MSTGKTNNIQLNQWVPQDSFLREEFNEDNRKIDTAITGLQAELQELRYVTLLDVTTAQTAQQVDFDVSSIDFTQYLRLEFYMMGITCTETTSIWMRTNGVEAGYSHFVENGISTTAVNYFASLSPGRHPMRYNFTFPVQGTPVGFEGDGLQRTVAADGTVTSYRSRIGGVSPVNWEDLRALNFVGINQTIPAGARFVMLGVKR